jgi:hypothetical protein
MIFVLVGKHYIFQIFPKIASVLEGLSDTAVGE